MNNKFYLKTLLIQNFATFKNQKINFKPGLNVIIGETGSGKSLLLDALQLIFGGRADKKIVRRETDHALIEATLVCSDESVTEFFESEGFPSFEGEIIIKRLILKNGVTKNYINHQNCTLSLLSTFSKKYIDLVGQFENQKLLSDTYQLKLLDCFADQEEYVLNYLKNFGQLKNLKKQFEELNQSKLLRDQRLDYLNFQLQEIDKLNPTSQDEEDLLKKKNVLINLERSQKVFQYALQNFEGSDESPGIQGHISQLRHLFNKNNDLLNNEMGILSEIEDNVQTLVAILSKKLAQEYSLEDLDMIIDRLDSYQKLKKKFGGSVESMLQTQVDFLKERSFLETTESNLNDLSQLIHIKAKDLLDEADFLHKKRLNFSKKLSQDLTRKIQSLNMSGATIQIDVTKTEELNEMGCSKIIFSAETNPGEGFYKVKEIASGGELSRILLALRQVLSLKDSISIFLFDEIDTGIGGETGAFIGRALSEVAVHGQVITITHLPQIAQFAEKLIIVNKDTYHSDHETRTESRVREIGGKFIAKEVKEMAQLNQ